jgi:enoyl-CoA hydratase
MQENEPSYILFNEIPTNSGQLGLITLNRPAALNALSAQMVVELSDKLHTWAKQTAIQAVIVQSSNERAFSAGGDIKQLYQAGASNYAQGMPFFRYEYQLNKFIHNYPKPYIALINGVTMGGGLGLSVHGSHVIAAENLKLAMPETGIGLYPDVGASYFLSRCPHYLGMYLGLTGSIIGVADAILCGLVQFYVPFVKFSDLLQAIAAKDLSQDAENTIRQTVVQFAQKPEASSLQAFIPQIEKCFSGSSVDAIIAALQRDGSVWALEQVQILHSKSPTSLKVTHRAISLGAKLSIDECMDMEFNLTQHLIQGHDIYEGIRAALIDKTHDPKWQPARLENVSNATIDELFKLTCKL